MAIKIPMAPPWLAKPPRQIYGSVTDLPWGFIFVRDGQTLPMHPTQIYEMLYCLITFAITWWLYWKKQAYKKRPGLIFSVFLLGVFGSRFLLEFIKLNQEDFESGMILNMGQILSIPFILWGFWLIYKSSKVQVIDEKRKWNELIINSFSTIYDLLT